MSKTEWSGETVETLADFVRLVVDYFPNNRWLFRGQGKISDRLLPMAGRKKFFQADQIKGRDADIARFRKWVHQSVAFSTDLPNNEFEQLAYAQHNGLATRLLDWTLNAAVALYFATEDQESKPDGGVFFLRHPQELDEEASSIKDCTELKMYQPRPITQRVIAQDSVFTIHPRRNEPLKWKPISFRKLENGQLEPDGNLLAVRVPGKRKRVLQEQLRAIGVLRRSLFPDIEGLSKSMNCVSHWMAHKRK